MEIEQAIFGKLTTDATVTARIGTRLYPGQAPADAALPLSVYGKANQQYIMALARRLSTNRYTMHLDVWARDYDDCQAAYHAIRDSLAGFAGTLGEGGETVAVLGIFDEGGDDDAEGPIFAEENGLYRAGIDLSITYQKGA